MYLDESAAPVGGLEPRAAADAYENGPRSRLRGPFQSRVAIVYRRSGRVLYALLTEPNSSMRALVFSTMASRPGLSTLRGSKPLPSRSLPASM